MAAAAPDGGVRREDAGEDGSVLEDGGVTSRIRGLPAVAGGSQPGGPTR